MKNIIWTLQQEVDKGDGQFMMHDRAMVDESFDSKNDDDDNNCGFDRFTSLFLCPDPILSDSLGGGAHLIFSVVG